MTNGDQSLPGSHVITGTELLVYEIAIVALGVSMLFALMRLVRGPSLADRVVALDLMALFAAGAIAITSVMTERAALLMVAVIVALLTFMGTTAFALYLERKGREDAQ